MPDGCDHLMYAKNRPFGGPVSALLLDDRPRSARAARTFVREFLLSWAPAAPEEHVDDVVLVVSELVTNAVRYGTEPGDLVRLVLALDSPLTRTRVEVHDPVRRRPRRRSDSAVRGRGRGLLVVGELCEQRWGVEDLPLGKRVWAEVPLGGPR